MYRKPASGVGLLISSILLGAGVLIAALWLMAWAVEVYGKLS